MRIFFDTEFNGFREDSRLLSIGLVSEDGRECYVEMPTRGAHLRDAADFVFVHVVSQFGLFPDAQVSNYPEMGRRVAAFLNGFPGRLELHYDWKLDWRHLDHERAWLAAAEKDYRRFVSAWRERPPAKRRPALEGGKD